MEFNVYNCQCIALSDDQAFSAEDAPVKKKRLELMDQILTADKLDYPVAARMGVPFKMGKQLLLIRKDACKRDGESDKSQAELTLPYSKAFMLYAHKGFYVMSVQEKAILSSGHGGAKYYDFKKPSSLVILVNTLGRQLLLVRANSVLDAFQSTQAVANIFEDTLKALLNPYQLDVHICLHESLGEISITMEETSMQKNLHQQMPCETELFNMAAYSETLIKLSKKRRGSFYPKTKSAMEKFRENVEEQIKSWPDRLTLKA